MTNPNKIKVQQRAAQEAKGKADALSSKLYHLEDVAHLAAFAAESRRVLEEIENVTRCRPGMTEIISTGVSNSDHWTSMKDVASLALSNLALELHEINNAFLTLVYDLADSKAGGTGGEVST